MEQIVPSKNFFKKVVSSIYGPKYYQELLNQPLAYSIKYFLVFTSIFGVLFVVGFSLFSFPGIDKTLNDVVRKTVNSYPQELAVTVKGGNVSTNVPEPFYIKLPVLTDESDAQLSEHKNLITIDTKSEASADSLLKYDTALLVTKNYIVYQKSNGQIVTQPLEKVSDVVIDKAFLIQFVDKYSPYLKLLLPLMAIGLLIFIIFFIAFQFCYLFLAALLIWLIAHIKKVEMSYGKSYQLGLHLMTLPLLIISPFSFINFPFAFTLLLLILAFINIRKKEELIVVQVDLAQGTENQPSSAEGQV
ncbi:MAG: DUF1189 family protein [Candidatus Moraniibacteriota bacterium]